MQNELKNHTNEFDNLSNSEDSLQKYLKHKKISFLKRLGVLVVLWSIIVSYFILPISKVGTPSVEGIKNLTINDVIDIGRVNSTTYLWENNTAEQIELLSAHPLIKNVEITVNVFGMHIEIEETYPLAKLQSSINCTDLACFDYYFSDLSYVTGIEVFQSKPLTKSINCMKYLPILSNFETEELLTSVLTQLGKIDYDILENIMAVSFENDYLQTDEISVIRFLINKEYLNLDANLILFVDLNRISYKINSEHLEIIANNIQESAKIDNSNYCLSYLGNQTASCKASVK